MDGATYTQIINCSNKGNIVGDTNTGGIVGIIQGKIINCYNIGNITGNLGSDYGAVGGICGRTDISDESTEIYNCFNVGRIISNSKLIYSSAGGILGSSSKYGSNCKIINCYNIGKVNYAVMGYGGIVGGYWYGNLDNTAKLINNYYQEDGELKGYGNFSGAVGVEKKSKDYMYSNSLVTKLNEYIENNFDEIDTNDWKHWKLGEDGYPTFE